MEGNKITIAILVSTYALIITAICISSNYVFPTDSLNPSNPSSSDSKCWSPPIKLDATKSFFWTPPPDWPAGVYPLCEELITVEYWNCTAEEGDWVTIYTLLTDKDGKIVMPYLLPGDYHFSWVGDPTCACCHMDWYHTITCCFPYMNGEFPDNFVTKMKGGDKAFLFFNSTERSSNSWVRLTTTNLNQSLLGERCRGDRH